MKTLCMNIKKHKNTLLLVASMIVLLPSFIMGLLLTGFTVVHGLPSGATGVFGGRITSVTQCTCTGGHVITVGPPRSATLYFVPGLSILYEYGQIKKVGAWVLGNYTSPTMCLRLQCPCGKSGCCCVPVSHQGNIQIVGTSR